MKYRLLQNRKGLYRPQYRHSWSPFWNDFVIGLDDSKWCHVYTAVSAIAKHIAEKEKGVLVLKTDSKKFRR